MSHRIACSAGMVGEKWRRGKKYENGDEVGFANVRSFVRWEKCYRTSQALRAARCPHATALATTGIYHTDYSRLVETVHTTVEVPWFV